jgi:imidazolonepropionase-like amidohydrolase
VGKLADLLVIDGDPLDDIRVLEDRDRLLAVMKGGRLVTDRLPDVEGPRVTAVRQ